MAQGHNQTLEARMAHLCQSLDRLADLVGENLRIALQCIGIAPDTALPTLKSTKETARAAREECLLLITREHPLARDLKNAMAALRIEHDYERAQELTESFYDRMTVLRNAPFFDVCQEMNGIGEDLLKLHGLTRLTWSWGVPIPPELPAQITELMLKIKSALTSLQNGIMEKIADQRGSPALLADLVLACRHLKRLAVLLEAIPEERTAFDRRS